MTDYSIVLSDGTAYATVRQLERNGPDNRSTPRLVNAARPEFNIIDLLGSDVTIPGDVVPYFQPGYVLQIVNSTGNDGLYNVVSATTIISGGPPVTNTVITLDAPLPQDITVDGNLFTHIFVVGDDITARFVTGFPFEIVGSATIDGTYTVLAPGAVYDPTYVWTIIPVVHGAIRDNLYPPRIEVPWGGLQYTNGDNNTTLLLDGQGVRQYGEDIANNFVHLLENSAADVSPDVNPNIGLTPAGLPLEGQLWWNKIDALMEVYNGTVWTATKSIGYESLVAFDIEDSNKRIHYTASETNLPAPWAGANEPGAVFWPESDPASSEALIRILSNDGNERLRVEHDGNVTTTNELQVYGVGDSGIWGQLAIGGGLTPVQDQTLTVMGDGISVNGATGVPALINVNADAAQDAGIQINGGTNQESYLNLLESGALRGNIRIDYTDANNTLEINDQVANPVTIGTGGGNVGIGAGSAVPTAPFEIDGAIFFHEGGNNAATGPDVRFVADGLIAAEGNLYANFDSDGSTDSAFIVSHGTGTSAATPVFQLEDNLGWFDVPTVQLRNTGELRFMESGGLVNYVGLTGPTAPGATTTYTLPPVPVNELFLTTDASGILSWNSVFRIIDADIDTWVQTESANGADEDTVLIQLGDNADNRGPEVVGTFGRASTDIKGLSATGGGIAGSALNLNGGNGDTTGAGGDVNVAAGTGGASGNGGDVTITGGVAGTGTSGDINLLVGLGTTDGVINLNSADALAPELRFFNTASTFSIRLKAPDAASADVTYTLPESPVAEQFLTTDAVGVTSWNTIFKLQDADLDTFVRTEVSNTSDEDEIVLQLGDNSDNKGPEIVATFGRASTDIKGLDATGGGVAGSSVSITGGAGDTTGAGGDVSIVGGTAGAAGVAGNITLEVLTGTTDGAIILNSSDALAPTLQFNNTASTFAIGVKAPDAATADLTYVLPETPAVGSFLTSTVGGVMSWGTIFTIQDADGDTFIQTESSDGADEDTVVIQLGDGSGNKGPEAVATFGRTNTTIKGLSATGGGAAGNDIIVIGGAGNVAGAGGDAYIAGGAAGASGAGGGVILQVRTGTTDGAILLDSTDALAPTLRFNNTASTFSVGLKAPDALAADVTYVLPETPADDTRLETDSAGTTSWVRGEKFDLIVGTFGSPAVTATLTNVSAIANDGTRAYVQVFVNGLLQHEGVDYDVTGPAELTFTYSLDGFGSPLQPDVVAVYQL